MNRNIPDIFVYVIVWSVLIFTKPRHCRNELLNFKNNNNFLWESFQKTKKKQKHQERHSLPQACSFSIFLPNALPSLK